MEISILKWQEVYWYTELGPIHMGWFNDYFAGLVQERCNSIANAMELCLSRTNPSISCQCLAHYHDLMTYYIYIYASVNKVIIGSGNGLAPIQYEAINWTSDDL